MGESCSADSTSTDDESRTRTQKNKIARGEAYLLQSSNYSWGLLPDQALEIEENTRSTSSVRTWELAGCKKDKTDLSTRIPSLEVIGVLLASLVGWEVSNLGKRKRVAWKTVEEAKE